MYDLAQITARLIQKSFPELRNIRILVYSTPQEEMEDVLTGYSSFRGEFYLDVNEVLNARTLPEIEGGLILQLASIAFDLASSKEQSTLARLARLLISNLSEKRKKLRVQAIDLEVLKRGYSEELLAFLLYAERNGYTHSVGHSYSELRQLQAK